MAVGAKLLIKHVIPAQRFVRVAIAPKIIPKILVVVLGMSVERIWAVVLMVGVVAEVLEELIVMLPLGQ
jgi:hypothetical protein